MSSPGLVRLIALDGDAVFPIVVGQHGHLGPPHREDPGKPRNRSSVDRTLSCALSRYPTARGFKRNCTRCRRESSGPAISDSRLPCRREAHSPVGRRRKEAREKTQCGRAATRSGARKEVSHRNWRNHSLTVGQSEPRASASGLAISTSNRRHAKSSSDQLVNGIPIPGLACCRTKPGHSVLDPSGSQFLTGKINVIRAEFGATTRADVVVGWSKR